MEMVVDSRQVLSVLKGFVDEMQQSPILDFINCMSFSDSTASLATIQSIKIENKILTERLRDCDIFGFAGFNDAKVINDCLYQLYHDKELNALKRVNIKEDKTLVVFNHPIQP